MIKLIENTPIERWIVEGKTVWVKREDLCTPSPGPPFSKVRGVYKHLQQLKSQGIWEVGYVETDISMAGIAVAWASKELGMRCHIFFPQHKEPPATGTIYHSHIQKWIELGADLIPIKPGRAKVNFYTCVRDFPSIHFLPLGLPLNETVKETAAEFKRTPNIWATVIVAVGSGTICAGLLSAMTKGHLIGVMCRTGEVVKKRRSIWLRSGKGMLLHPVAFTLVDPGYEYMDSVQVDCPFPTHPYYDAKAVKYVVDNIASIEAPVLLWNIGRAI